MDSPLSEADSLSSIGASTEPLPASEMGDSSDVEQEEEQNAPPPPPRRPAAASAKKSAGVGGEESDSSLTEVSDSGEEEEEEEQEVQEEEDDGKSLSSLPYLSDDEDEQPTPRAVLNSKKRSRVVADDEEEDEEDDDEVDENRSIRRSPSLTAGEGGTAALSAEEEEEQQEDDAILALAAGAALKKVASYNAAEALPHPAEDGEEDEDERPAKRIKEDLPLVNGAGGSDSLSELDDEDGEVKEESDVPLAVAAAQGKGKKSAAVGKKGKGKAPAKRPPSPSFETDDPSPSAQPQAAAVEMDVDPPTAGEESVEEPLAAAVATTVSSARGGAKGKARGRGRGRGKGARGGAAAVAVGAGMERSGSTDSSTTAATMDAFPSTSTSTALHRSTSSAGGAIKPFGSPSVSASASQTPLPSGLPAPSGLVELDTTSGADHLAGQLVELANGSSAAAAEEDGMEGVELTGPREEETPAPQLDAEQEDLDHGDREVEPTPPPPSAAASANSKRPPPSAKKGGAVSGGKGGKKGGKGVKGKEKAAMQQQQQDVEWTPTGVVGGEREREEEGEGSEGEEGDTSDAAFLRKRAEAMEALTKIEIQFAQLRDVLYVERMEEVEKERAGIENGTHPELLHLTQLIELRRDNKLQLARRWLDGLEQSYQLQFDHNEHALWNRWQDERARLRTRMLDDANGKRRRLEREKRMLERPKDDSLASLLAPRPPPAVPLHYRRRLGFDGEPLVDNEITWALRHPDVRADAGVKGLEDEMCYSDLEQMGLREPIRHPIYPYDPVYAHPPSLGSSAYADPRAAAAGYGYAASAYDPSTLALQQQQQQQQQLHHASSFPTLGALPPLPGQGGQSAISRAPSIPNLRPGASAFSQSPVDSTFAQHHQQQQQLGSYPPAPAPRTTFSNGSHYPYDAQGEERLHGPAAWAKASQAQAQAASAAQHPLHPAYGAAQEDEQRRRTISAGGALADPMQQHQNGFGGAAAAMAAEQNGGRKTPVNGGGKGRFTLDDHMSHRSPKAAAPSAPTAAKTALPASSTSGSGRNSPAAFMSIPTIPPFDRHRHEQRLLAQQQQQPLPPATSAPATSAASIPAVNVPAPTAQPPVLNPLAKSAQSLFGIQPPTAAAPVQGQPGQGLPSLTAPEGAAGQPQQLHQAAYQAAGPPQPQPQPATAAVAAVQRAA